jgi:glycosyltransferase involved in cell wall biosynthesis
MRVLLIEPYDTGSHAAWARGYRDDSRHQVDLMTLPGRFWRWRLRGAAVEIADRVDQWCAVNGPPGAVLVSSMIDLAALLGLARRSLGSTPVVLYMHENQLAYPRPDAADIDAAIRGWASLVAADRVVFNSSHHRDVVVAALPRLGDSMPDRTPDLDPAWLLAKSTVVPVGIDFAQLTAPAEDPDRGSLVPLIVWSHRWDDDKNPEVFVRASHRLRADGLEHRVALLGDDGWDGEARRSAAAEALGGSVAVSGHLGRQAYVDVLRQADVVVSVADHEFFGVSVVEAIAAGCVPVLPDRLSYPELIEARHRSAVLYPEGHFRRRLAEVVANLPQARRATAGLAEAMARFAWPEVADQLDEVVDAAVLSSP